MEALKNYTVRQLEELLRELMEEYRGYQARGLALDMSRGKPNTDQLDLCQGMLDTVSSSLGAVSGSGVDCRNYGLLEGLPEVRRLLADMLNVREDEIIVGGNSSLNMMYDCMSRALLYGVYGSDKPWCKEPEIKFLCPVPGYDRHFAITQHFGIKMINIDMTPEGPDMDQVEKYVADPSVKGIWCVPKYSNPTGVTYSNRVVRRFAKLRPAAQDFRIFWDNAYTIHDLYEEGDTLLDLFALLKDEDKEDMVFIFGSTSKISFAGAGLAAVAASTNNIRFMMRQMAIQTISYDKISQLMHVRFFGDYSGIKAHMKKHAAILRPKFELVEDILAEELSGLEVARWTKPRGGYFISFETMPGCAKRTVSLCKEAGVVLTAAGAAFPYGIDPKNSNIRIAPSYPTLGELETAARLFCLAVKIASVENLLIRSV
ncbi:MAG: aminotransferase class I/II-fold pyridoxal phosphate-dependent enzyme [Angelakisella sp.]|jgi:DNA-binding transcriptional MocR family regulator|nr:aminotransferase class I/II-fold pyridoxal phosphate-dependent enzyme [Angelakisella sp.]MCI9528734.1 aminotransferase class I/II-fold pyridoxal phosphate-dependent enzyme [Angelakisella sp.]